MATAWYLYCIAPAGRLASVTEPGVDGAPVVAAAGGDWDAVLSEVPIEEFCGPEAENRLQDLAWVAPRACRHETVVEAVMRQAPVLPARFATLFGSIGRLHDFLACQHDRIRAFFDWLGDKREWSVKGIRAVARPAAGQNGFAPGDFSGRHYLERKRAETVSARGESQRLREICRQAARELQTVAQGFREGKILEAVEPAGEVVVNWAFAVGVAAEPDFRGRVAELEHRYTGAGLAFRLSGPWPPYHFAPELAAGERA